MSNYNEISKLVTSFYIPKQQMDVYNIFLKHKIPYDIPYYQSKNIYISKQIESQSLFYVQQKLGYPHIPVQWYIDNINFTNSINLIIEKYNSNITKSGQFGWTIPYLQQYQSINLPMLPNSQIKNNIIVTKSANNFYQKRLQSLISFDISNFNKDNMYKPSSIQYNNCIISSCYIDILNNQNISLFYDKNKENNSVMIRVSPYFSNINLSLPFIFFNKPKYNFISQSVIIKIDWKIQIEQPAPFTQGVFVIKYGDKQNWIQYITQSNSYNNFSIIVSKSSVIEYIDQKNNIDLSIGFIFYNKNSKPIYFCNASITQI